MGTSSSSSGSPSGTPMVPPWVPDPVPPLGDGTGDDDGVPPEGDASDQAAAAGTACTDSATCALWWGAHTAWELCADRLSG